MLYISEALKAKVVSMFTKFWEKTTKSKWLTNHSDINGTWYALQKAQHSFFEYFKATVCHNGVSRELEMFSQSV